MKGRFHKGIVQTKGDTLYFQCQPLLWVETLLSGVVAISIKNGYFPFFYAKDKNSFVLFVFTLIIFWRFYLQKYITQKRFVCLFYYFCPVSTLQRPKNILLFIVE
jgi:hypothetical protein